MGTCSRRSLTLFSVRSLVFFLLFFFNDTATTEIYTLSLHDALPISQLLRLEGNAGLKQLARRPGTETLSEEFRDRKSTRLNSSHTVISYAVFCLKKKKTTTCKKQIDTHHDTL